MASVDTLEDNTKFAQMHDADFPILADPDRKVAAAYGVLPDRPNPVARRWTFYIGPDGKILHIDTAVRAQSAGEDLVAKLEELKVRKK
jgi:thioredoxin-dependent peroxiredoxin